MPQAGPPQPGLLPGAPGTPYGTAPGSGRTWLIAGLVGAVVLVLAVLAGVIAVVAQDDEEAVTSGKLDTPVSLREVTAVTDGACAAGSGGLASEESPPKCYTTTGGMTLTAVDKLRAMMTANNGWGITIDMRAPDAKLFGDLTTRVHTRQSPLNRIAIIVGDKVISAPQVASPILGGNVEITGNFTKKRAEQLADRISGGE